MNVHYAPKLCLPRNAVFGGILILTAGLLVPAATAQDNSRGGGGHIDHIFYIMMENHSTSEILGNVADAPFTNQLARRYGVATTITESPTRVCPITWRQSPAIFRASGMIARQVPRPPS